LRLNFVSYIGVLIKQHPAVLPLLQEDLIMSDIDRGAGRAGRRKRRLLSPS